MLYLGLPILIGGIVLVCFGFSHLFAPRIYHWREYYSKMAQTVIDTILSVNIFLSLLIIFFGIISILIPFYYWENIQLIKIILSIESIILFLRFLYALFKPIKDSKKGLNLILGFLFAISFCLFFIPLLIFQEFIIV